MKATVLATLLAIGAAQAASVPKVHALSTPGQLAQKAAKTTQATFYNGTCTEKNVRTRKEWRNMSKAEKSAYLEAEKCLYSLPAQTDITGVDSRFSDLQGLHRSLTNVTMEDVFVGDIIHNVGQFFPWHRYFMYSHEYMMRSDCNYTGPMAWWDEELDANAGDMFRSEMWDSDAFGGNGVGDDNCLTDGAFANTTEYMGPGLANTPSGYCLDREWTSEYMQYSTTENIETCTKYGDYYSFMNCMVATYTSPHVAGHNASGGLMSDIYASAGDPIFFMHHNYIDRMWWKWQETESSRLFDMSGNAFNMTQLEADGSVLPSGVNANTTLDYILTVADILPDIKVEKVMNIQDSLLCYKYDY